MAKKILWGCSVFLVLFAVGIAVLVALRWDRSGIDASDSATDSLSQDLEREFGGQPRVEFLCILPVVGPAPCILNSDTGSREVTLTFTNYELPQEVTAEDLARRIAALSFETSEFVKQSDRTAVVFELTEGGTSQTSKYSFGPEELAAAAAGEAEEE